jgi:lipoprotein-anchoring transpeptidase ErfK/SrfK
VLVGLFVVGFVIAGCVTPTARTTATIAPVPVVRHRSVRTVVLHRAPAVADGAAAAPRPVVSSPPPSPWSRFDATLSGPTYEVARARFAVGVFVAPDGSPATVLSPLTKLGAPRVLLVVADEDDWLQVLLPLRPNGSVGWVRRVEVDLSTVTLRVEIDRATHRLRLFDGAAVVMDEPVAVGRAATPTPAGQFYVTELLRPPNARGAYGPYAFTLSAYSNVYQRFGSGDGAVGLHGTNEPRSLGADASHGCVRVSNDVIQRLAATLPLGTPVVIR